MLQYCWSTKLINARKTEKCIASKTKYQLRNNFPPHLFHLSRSILKFVNLKPTLIIEHWAMYCAQNNKKHWSETCALHLNNFLFAFTFLRNRIEQDTGQTSDIITCCQNHLNSIKHASHHIARRRNIKYHR